ncbi:putative ATP synthase subunit O, mitochondrial [Iris pallida]|uniref:ATP synthase subunit O, mitochondrial n=1 Tax=Iris pallida TaxID=29817 RepID=A0AAX6EEY3_IRIPA|nr:putative ATP synthase subunit O, mitochondrial [Iris pallida]KAJ6853191.1 putative ATP synthase subunit O, mitochondrial [Iris pallida]
MLATKKLDENKVSFSSVRDSTVLFSLGYLATWRTSTKEFIFPYKTRIFFLFNTFRSMTLLTAAPYLGWKVAVLMYFS